MPAMAKLIKSCLCILSILTLLFGFEVYAVPYDYTFTAECLAKPLSPQYHGGVVVNPELNEGLKGWTMFGDVKVEHVESDDGNKYIIASNRSQSFHSFSQKFNLEKEKLYTLSAWLQVSEGKADIAAIVKTETGFETAGWVTAQKGCWSMLKGGLVVNVTGPAELYFESNNSAVDIWADSISLQPFTQEEWKSHQDESVEKVRKTTVKFQAVDQNGRPLPNATISISLRRGHFPFGCAINQNILYNGAYQNWFASRFKYTVFENELKWPSIEPNRGYENYAVSDAMVNFARSRGIAVRGHNVFWNDPKFQTNWIGGLNTYDLWAAVNKRVYSVVGRYRGQLIHWDVVNENLHWRYFEDKLGWNASNIFYQKASATDRRMIPFLNEFNTIEESSDGAVSPWKYLERIRYMWSCGYRGRLGIGLQGHFGYPNLPYIRSAIDILASARLPIWITELDVKASPNQAAYLDQILNELHSHRAIQGIILWSAWSPQGCYAMCLTDNNFRNLATGDVVDRFMRRYTAVADLSGTTDSNGFFETSLVYGEYEAKVTHPMGGQFSASKYVNLAPDDAPPMVQFKVDV